MVADIAEIFHEVDTPVGAPDYKPIDKRQALKDVIRRGQKHLLPKKCTETSLDKASPEVIEKIHNEYVQRELQEKGEKTAKALSSQAISMYAKVVGSVVSIDSAEGLRADIEEDPIIKDSMADLGILVYSAFGRFLTPLLVVAHTVHHCQLTVSKSGEERADEQQDKHGEQSVKDTNGQS